MGSTSMSSNARPLSWGRQGGQQDGKQADECTRGQSGVACSSRWPDKQAEQDGGWLSSESARATVRLTRSGVGASRSGALTHRLGGRPHHLLPETGAIGASALVLPAPTADSYDKPAKRSTSGGVSTHSSTLVETTVRQNQLWYAASQVNFSKTPG